MSKIVNENDAVNFSIYTANIELVIEDREKLLNHAFFSNKCKQF